METSIKEDLNQPLIEAEEFYNQRQNRLKSNISTEDLLKNLRPASDDYDKISNEPFQVGGQGKLYRI